MLCGPSYKPFTERVRFIGDKVAIVVADSEEIAAEACKAIVVDYEDLPRITDPLQAMQPEAFLLHPDLESNIFCHYRIRKGDTAEAFKSADVIIEDDI